MTRSVDNFKRVTRQFDCLPMNLVVLDFSMSYRVTHGSNGLLIRNKPKVRAHWILSAFLWCFDAALTYIPTGKGYPSIFNKVLGNAIGRRFREKVAKAAVSDASVSVASGIFGSILVTAAL